MKDSLFSFKAFEKNEITFYNAFKKQQHSKNKLKFDRCNLYLQKHVNYNCNSSIYNYKLLYTTTAFLERDVLCLE